MYIIVLKYIFIFLGKVKIMAEFSKNLLDMLSEFMIRELGSKPFNGVTYTMLLNNDIDSETYKEYMMIKQEAVNCGYTHDEVFRTYKVSNGYIFDMDLATAKQIMNELYKVVARANKLDVNVSNNANFLLIDEQPDKARKTHMVNIAKLLKEKYDKGEKTVELALFSRNSGYKITRTASLQDGTPIVIKYDAFPLRHWDIEEVNEKFLIPAGFRVKRIQPLEIFPTKAGVIFEFTMESLNEYKENLEQEF